MHSAGSGATARSHRSPLVILALGLGANTALFSVTNAVLLRPLPFPAPDRLVVLRLFDPEFQGPYPSFPVNAAHIAVWRERCASCEDLAAINAITTTLTGRGEAEQLDGASVSASFFELLGISPILGRSFRPGEDRVGQNAVAIISHALWMRRFGGDPTAIGQRIQLDRELVEIVGILPAGRANPWPAAAGRSRAASAGHRCVPADGAVARGVAVAWGSQLRRHRPCASGRQSRRRCGRNWTRSR